MSGIVLTVSSLNDYAAKLLRRDFVLRDVKVSGELADVKRQTSGHTYFTLKDELASIRCVMFRSDNDIDFLPENGMSVIVRGYVSIYPQGGQYQLYVKGMEQQGLGELFVRFNKLKERLSAEGLFLNEHKKPLPILPKAIGVITSETGAVIQDIINIATRRFPTMPIYLYPVKVQGAGAALEIANAIRIMDEMNIADVLIVGRGGGSMEDLWAFNEEIVAWAIYRCNTPIVSAVGHETDFSISDYVADMRAPTPSAAAELCVPVLDELYEKVFALTAYLKNSVEKRIRHKKLDVESITKSYLFGRVNDIIDNGRRHIDALIEGMTYGVKHGVDAKRARVVMLNSMLEALSPYEVLKRGYAIISNGESYISSAKGIETGDKVTIIMHDGRVEAITCRGGERDGKQ